MSKHFVSWQSIHDALEVIDVPGTKVYGVPRGGMILAGFLKSATNVDCADGADIILDDIIDSGTTRDRYQAAYPEAAFVALFDKTGADNDIGWVVFPWEVADGPQDDAADAQDHIRRILQMIEGDANREGLIETPKRVVKSWAQLYNGYDQKPKDILKTFKEGACDEMVLLRDIELFSTCEHHMLPFFGKCHIAYIPNGKVVGISKLARLMEIYARRLQIQERIGEEITKALMEHLEPLGAACIIEAQHFCMTSRGVEKQNSIMVTSSLKGVFKEFPETRSEFMALVYR